jgi:class 3 adenylate cyclase/tetratricopeptide (TPR) repeat protein/ribosomal protein L40E
MKCPKCQFENPGEMQFCGKCGAKLENICPQCNSSNPSDFRFCGKCGHSLKGSSDASTIDYSQPQSYTPKFLADKILTTRSSIEGERKLVTVLFADVANFTSISEKLDPEEIHRIMDGCFKVLMDEIHRYEGTINQFTGDGVMALFGAPVAHEDHGQRACYTALSIQKAMGNYDEKLKKEYGIKFKMRIGLNSGPVIVGSIGDDLRMDYTAVGDTTNLASRMESMAGSGSIFVSKYTHRLARDFFEFKFLGNIDVKGKKEPQDIFELFGVGEVDTRIGASVAKGLTQFVGRKNSMVALMDAYDKTRSGSGQVVGVVGDAGVGKSRLMLEFRNQLSQGEFAYFEGQCLHFGGSMSYLPILDIIRSYFEIKEGDQEFLIKKNMEGKIVQLDEKLHDVLPPFHELLSLDVEDAAYKKLEPMQKREKTFEAIRDLLVYGSQNRPIILVVEDLHWIDKTSEEFLDYLIGWLAGARILLILLYRPEYTHHWGSKSYYNRIGLDQLTPKSSAELIRSILQDGEAVPELRELILDRAAGNPLFMEEFTHTLLENGSIRCKDRKCVLIKNASEIQVPDTIEGIIAARMDRLEDDIKRTMQVASVIGRDFAFRILETITEMRQGLKSYLLNLQGLEFIYEKNLFPELEYVFKHALTQEVAYNSLLQQRRKEIHEKIGRAIEELYPERLEEFYEMLAYHYSKSENSERTYQYLKVSGQKAMRNNSAWEALNYYRQALSVLDRMPEDTKQKNKKLEVLYLSISPLIALGFPENSLSILEQGEQLARELDDQHRLFRFHTNIGFFYCTIGNYPDARPYIEQAFDAAEKLHDVDLMGAVAPDLFAVYMPLAEHAKLVDVVGHIIDVLEKNQKIEAFFGGPCNVYAVLLSLCGFSLAWTGNFNKALSHCEKGLKAAAGIDDIPTLGMCENSMGGALGHKGDLKEAKEYLELAIMHNEKVQYTPTLPYSHSWFGLVCALAGDPQTGRKHVEKGLKICSDAEYNWMKSHQYFCLGVCHAESGEYDVARHAFEKGLEICRENHEKITEGSLLIWLGRVLGKSQLPENAEAHNSILRGIRVSEELSHRPDLAIGNFFLGEFYADRGEKEEAVEYLKKALKLFNEMEMQYWPDEVQKVISRLQ